MNGIKPETEKEKEKEKHYLPRDKMNTVLGVQWC